MYSLLCSSSSMGQSSWDSATPPFPCSVPSYSPRPVLYSIAAACQRSRPTRAQHHADASAQIGPLLNLRSVRTQWTSQDSHTRVMTSPTWHQRSWTRWAAISTTNPIILSGWSKRGSKLTSTGTHWAKLKSSNVTSTYFQTASLQLKLLNTNISTLTCKVNAPQLQMNFLKKTSGVLASVCS